MGNVTLSMREAVNGNYRMQLDGYYYKAWENYEMVDFHKHMRVEFMYVDDGECQIFVIKNAGKQDDATRLTLSKNEGILIDSDVWHKLVIKDKCRIINMEFLLLPNAYSINTLKEAAYISSELNVFMSKFREYTTFFDRNNVGQLARLILEDAKRSKEFSDYENVMNTYINLLMTEIARSHNKAALSQSYEIYVKKALKYINAHIKERIRSKDIADYAEVNYAYLEHLFKNRTGETLGEYIMKQKVELAESMVSNTSLPISVIAEQLGFGSRQQFNNAFKKIKGVSPQKYRYEQFDKGGEIWYGFSGGYAFEIMKSNKKGEAENEEND
ncbi:MAG: helix-turn-helix transcriptional regulator [Clostridia bacterium]|nr:helix-turn-helix transcriptional regulator [Clostridia bacterium]